MRAISYVPYLAALILAVRAVPSPPSYAALMAVSQAESLGSTDVARLPDGREVGGALRTDAHGRITFQSPELDTPLPLGQLDEVVLLAERGVALPTYPLRRVMLWGEEVITGHLVELAAETGTLDLAAGGRLTVPRGALAGYRDPSGEATLVYHGFETPDAAALAAAGWTWTGDSVPLDGAQVRSGTQSLALREPDQTAAYSLPVPLDAGRVELSFFDDFAQHETLHWLVELEFAATDGAISLQPLLGWSGRAYDLALSPAGADQPSVQVQPLTRAQGWHRLSVSFDRGRLLGAIDSAELFSGRLAETRLTAIRLVRQATGEGETAPPQPEGEPPAEHGPVARIDDFKLVAYVASLEHSREHRDQDAVVLVLGDELFGRISGLDDSAVRLQLSDAPDRTPRDVLIPWPEIRAVHFRQRPIEAMPVAGPIVAVHVDVLPSLGVGAAPPEEDHLVGALVDVDESRLVIDHPYLGRVALARGLRTRLEVLFEGTQVVLDASHHHLGDEIRPDFPLAMPEGNGIAASVRFDALPEGDPFVAVSVNGVEGMGPGAEFRGELEAGDLRTYVVVNGQEVDFLNRHVQDPAGGPERLRVPIPRESLVAGENHLALIQRPRATDPNDFDDCIVHGLSVEFEINAGD